MHRYIHTDRQTDRRIYIHAYLLGQGDERFFRRGDCLKMGDKYPL